MSSLFEAHNARFTDLKTVGSTFVLRKEAFQTICQGRNTLLLGPRGSGKTTLLKMMKIGAQIAANKKENFQTLKAIDFYPVYLNADRQFELLTDGINFLNEKESRYLVPIGKTLTAIRTQFALLDTLAEISDPRTENIPVVSHLFVNISRRSEFEFCSVLQKAWNIDEDIGTLKELRAHLSGRIDRINSAVYSFSIFPDNPEYINSVASLFTDPITVADAFIRSFNDVFLNHKRRWCLCIDELEIMPEELQKYFFLSLRSTDASLLLKVATSPFTQAFSEFYAPTAATPTDGHDYDAVNLSEAHKDSSVKFTRKLVGELLRRNDLPGSISVQSMLGNSPITDDSATKESNGSAYAAPDGAHYKRFKNLAEIDEGFRTFLEHRKVDLSKVQALTEGSRAGNVRKAIWQVALRLEFGHHQKFSIGNKHGVRPSSKKQLSSIYTGASAVLTMCEGNPRVTIGLFKALISEFVKNNGKRVPVPIQAALIETTIAKYLSLLSAIPMQLPASRGRVGSVVTLLGRISRTCEQDNLVGEFKPESLSTIRINEDTDPKIIHALGNAINQGAFIMIEDKEGRKSYGDLRGARLRLSYLLCPKYKLPLIYGRIVPLSDVMNNKSISRNESTLRIRDLFINED